ncbi:DDRGK domain-containing protein 1-like [Dermacentor albipictus]|uniref:DDRGK domain-containing protein 1-like n=1 Tax=Dermacentor albipictus TaxID=60249 RepID=UPI0031FC30E2
MAQSMRMEFYDDSIYLPDYFFLSVPRQAKEHRDKMEDLQAKREATPREHEEKLQRVREEDKLRAQKREQEEREHLEEMERQQRERQRVSEAGLIWAGIFSALEELFSGSTTGGSSGPANLSQDFNGPPR